MPRHNPLLVNGPENSVRNFLIRIHVCYASYFSVPTGGGGLVFLLSILSADDLANLFNAIR